MCRGVCVQSHASYAETWVNEALPHVSDDFMPILKNMIQWFYNGCEMISLPWRSTLSVSNKTITVLLGNKMLVSLPNRLLLDKYSVILNFLVNSYIMCNLFRPLFFQNKVLGGLYETFNDVVDSMEDVGLTSFSRDDVSITIFILRCGIITKKEIGSSNYSKKLNNVKETLFTYSLSWHDLFPFNDSVLFKVFYFV